MRRSPDAVGVGDHFAHHEPVERAVERELVGLVVDDDGTVEGHEVGDVGVAGELFDLPEALAREPLLPHPLPAAGAGEPDVEVGFELHELETVQVVVDLDLGEVAHPADDDQSPGLARPELDDGLLYLPRDPAVAFVRGPLFEERRELVGRRTPVAALRGELADEVRVTEALCPVNLLQVLSRFVLAGTRPAHEPDDTSHEFTSSPESLEPPT